MGRLRAPHPQADRAQHVRHPADRAAHVLARGLDRRVKAIEDAGLGIGWRDGDPGLGPTYVFRDPDGHELEIYWESEWFEAPPSWRRR